MTAYRRGTTPQQRRWMFDTAQSLVSADLVDAVTVRLFGRQGTHEFLPAAVSPVPHAQRLQEGWAMRDELQRVYHPWPEDDYASLSGRAYATRRFFVAVRAGARAQYMASEGADNALRAAQELPRVGEYVQVQVGDTARTVQVVRLDHARDASASVEFDESFVFPVDVQELAAFYDAEVRAATAQPARGP